MKSAPTAVSALLACLAGVRPPTAAAAPGPSAAPGAPGGHVTISLVGTNDLHGHLEGLPVLGGYLANLRQARARDGGAVLLVDAGDMFQGTLESNLGEGAAVVRAYNALGYDAAAIGNHEFDFGPVGAAPTARGPEDDPRGALRVRATEARFPFLDANLIDEATGRPPAWTNVRPTTIVEVAGVKVGIVGVTTIATARTTLAANLVGLSVKPLAPAIAAAARELRRRGATVVVLAAHAGGGCKQLDAPADLSSCDGASEIFRVARALPAGAVDAIVAGHTHDGLAQRVAGIPIVESFANGRAFGRIDLAIERARGTVARATLFRPRDLGGLSAGPASYEGAPVVPAAAVTEAIAPAVAAARARREEKLGVEALASIPRAHKTESPLGNLVADLVREGQPGADVAIVNGGGLRADLPAGPLRYGALYEALPFDNSFATISLTGAELAATVAHNLGRDNGIVSISGVRATASCVGRTLTVTLTRPDGRPVAPAERLTLATSNFLATGGDGLFAGLAKRAAIDETRLIRDVAADLLRARRTPLRPDDPDLYDPSHPRLTYPAPRPVRCP